jgi:AAA15 family ATPase/GTPase
MFVKSIKIENFRCFQKLEINCLNKINLFVGANSCGKSSLLDGLFLLAGRKNPALITAIQNFRLMNVDNDNGYKYLFNDFNIDNPIMFNARLIDNKLLDLQIKASRKHINLKGAMLDNSSIETISENNITGLVYNFNDFNANPIKIEYSISKGVFGFSQQDKDDILAMYLNDKNKFSMAKTVNKMIITKSENQLLVILQKLNPDIIGIKMGANNMVCIDVKNKKELLPINVMGDGIIKIVSVLAAMNFVKGGILLIDEVENGLHFDSLKLLWKAVFEACKIYDVQLFATTHSYECVNSYQNAAQENDEISLIRLEKTNNEIKPIIYSPQNLKIAVDNEWEVR